MQAMVLEKIGQPLKLKRCLIPKPRSDELLIKVKACGVCRTDLHIVDGDLSNPKLPLILGHQIVGIVENLGTNCSQFAIGDRVGVPWLGHSCEKCEFCISGKENLCDHAIYTGYLRDGGFAEYCTAEEAFCLPLPKNYDNITVAPFLCAGLIGYRTFRLSGFAKTLGLYGFGSSAHLLIQTASAQGSEVYVFTRPNDAETQKFAKTLGAVWTGSSDELPPKLLDAALIFAPVGALYPKALQAVKKGGKVISAGIHMSDIPSFPYHLLWEERSLSSVANLTRQDGKEYMTLIKKYQPKATVHTFMLQQANEAINAIRSGGIRGSVVISFS